MSYQRGRLAEQAAARLLAQNKLAIIETNYRCRYGEIDIIAIDGEVLCFIEVRYRRNRRYGSALETIDQRKQRRIIQTAQQFLAQKWRGEPCACRFDVAVLEGPVGEPGPGLEPPEVLWLRGAFELPA